MECGSRSCVGSDVFFAVAPMNMSQTRVPPKTRDLQDHDVVSSTVQGHVQAWVRALVPPPPDLFRFSALLLNPRIVAFPPLLRTHYPYRYFLTHCLAVHPPTYLSISSILFCTRNYYIFLCECCSLPSFGAFCSLYPNSGACARCCNNVPSSKAPLLDRLTSIVYATLFVSARVPGAIQIIQWGVNGCDIAGETVNVS